MKNKLHNYLAILAILFTSSYSTNAQMNTLEQQAKETMLKATRYMVEEVSNNGGYVWNYLPDFSRQWGEMEAFKTMIWLQHPGTISMGHVFLDAYETTKEEYYYNAAEKAASAIIWGQSHEGGWNYVVDFAGDRSLKHWYNTIGKNGWRLEEFQHYYGNCTFDDDITSDAARFLLRMYLEKFDPKFKPALDKAIDFILQSQYPLGGWPQRYPLRYDFNKQGHPDYTSFYTFNDDVIWENVHFLIQCYLTLGEQRFLDPIKRGMEFYIFSQDACGAWAQQLNMDMQTAGARTYEPAAFLPSTTCHNAFLLLQFYLITGDRRYLVHVPKAIEWLEKTKLPEDQIEGDRTHPTFIEVGSNKPLYVHRKGSNVTYGTYYINHDQHNLLKHYYGKARVPLQQLIDEYNRISLLSIEEVIKDSPLKPAQFNKEGTPQSYYDLNRHSFDLRVKEKDVKEIIQNLDLNNRWLVKHVMISNPYVGDGTNKDLTDKYCSTLVGDNTDTSPFQDISDQEYISTGEYIKNMKILINFLKQNTQTINH